jgi:hypothetical protein
MTRSYKAALYDLVARIGGTIGLEPKGWPERGHMILVDAPIGTTWDEDISQYVCPSYRDAYERTNHAVSIMGGPFDAGEGA